MEARIQQALDDQWDALEARSPKVRRVRRQLLLLLDEFAAEKEKESAQLETALVSAQTQLRDMQRADAQRRELETQLRAESQSPLAAELAALSAEVADLDAQISALQEKRAVADKRRREVESVVSSRTARFRYALADLDGKNPPHDAAAVHGLQSQLARLAQQKNGADAESKAAQGGQAMWQHVCEQLEELDGDIRGLKRGNMDQISFLLKRKVMLLEKLASEAHESGWTALVVAIGHELQVLNQALDALNRAEHAASD